MSENPFEFLIENAGSINTGFFVSAGFIFFIKIAEFILISLAIFFILHGIYLIYKINTIGGRFRVYKDAFVRKTPPSYKGEFVTRWIQIKQRMETKNESDYKLAILEADKVFDDLLKRMMVKGKDMGGRLKQINEELLPSINKVWQSHKVRNKIAHKPDYHLSYSEAERVIENYEAALHDLNILD
jgi:hypothetical protein